MKKEKTQPIKFGDYLKNDTALAHVLQQQRDLRAIQDHANTPNRPKKGVATSWRPEFARFKIKFWFNNGVQKTFYSYDHQKNGKKISDSEYNGLQKLVNLAAKYFGNYKCAMIWATLDPGKKVDPKKEKYNTEVFKITEQSTWINPDCVFVDGDKLNIERLKPYNHVRNKMTRDNRRRIYNQSNLKK